MAGKYTTIQFTQDDLTKIKAIQKELEGGLGVKLSLSSVIMYSLDRLKQTEESVEARLTALENQASARNYTVPVITTSVGGIIAGSSQGLSPNETTFVS